MSMNISSFFKAYDLRGEYPHIDETIFYWTGKGLVDVILTEGSKEVAIMHDARVSAPSCAAALIKGIQDAGGTVRFFGEGSSDMLYGACQHLGIAGVMVTASHNPGKDIGAKFVKEAPQMLGLGSGLELIRDYVETNRTEEIPSSELPEIDPELKEVHNFFFSSIEKIGNTNEVRTRLAKKQLTIAVDAGNGAAGYFLTRFKDMYPEVNWIELYWEPDGTFPNHPANPVEPDTLEDIQKAIAEHSADFGVAFDGDADRLVILDETGNPIQGDFLMNLFIKEFAQRELPEGLEHAYVYIQPGSRCVPECVAETDGVSIPSMQGHSYVKKQMEKFNAIYGGEYSGHHYFGQFGFMDSGIIVLALFLDVFTKQELSVSELFKIIGGRYYLSDLINLNLPENTSFEDIKDRIKHTFSDATFSEFDGIAVYYPDWKFSVRPSNTEPKVRFVLETRGSDMREEKIAEVKQLFI